MRLSTKSRYGLRAMFDIVYNCESGSAQIQDIARRQQISQRYLEQIFQPLKKAGILKSKRGPLGGYMLARKPEEISLADIINATEGDLHLVLCSRKGKSKVHCQFDGRCVTQTIWQGADAVLLEYLNGMTLQSLVDRGRELGIQRESDAAFAFSI